MRIASYIAVFVGVVFLGDRLLSLAAMKVIQQSQNEFVRMYEGKNPADVLFLGDSRVDRNISSKQVQDMTGKVCLNLALGGNNMLVSEVLLKDFVERYGNPELVVIELSQTTVKPDSMGEMRIFSYASPNMRALARSIDPAYAAFESVFKSLRFNGPTFWRLSVEALRKPSSRLLGNTIPPEMVKKWENGGRVERPISESNMEALKRVCNYSDARDIRIRLLIGPCWKDFKKAIVDFESWKSALQKAAGRHYIYDYSELFVEHPDYFNDIMHLNAVGAKFFVQKLIEDKVL